MHFELKKYLTYQLKFPRFIDVTIILMSSEVGEREGGEMNFFVSERWVLFSLSAILPFYTQRGL